MAESKEGNSDRQDDSLIEAGKVPKLNNGFTDSLNVRSDSLLNRIGRLDATVAIMEKTSPSEVSEPLNSPSKTSPQLKHVSSPLNTPFGLDERRKPTEFVLEEVQKRGTLVERVSDLENRVMQLQRVFSARWSESAQQLCMVHDSSCSPRMESNDECSHQMLKDLNLEKQDCNLSHASSLKGHVEAVKDFGNHDPNAIKLKELCLDSYTDNASAQESKTEEEQDGRLASGTHKKKKKKQKWMLKNWFRRHFCLHRSLQVKGISRGSCCRMQAQPSSCWCGGGRGFCTHHRRTSQDEG